MEKDQGYLCNKAASTPTFFYAEIYRNGKSEIVEWNKLSDWLRKHDKGENHIDGFNSIIIHPKNVFNSEFSLKTTVFWVNGINTTLESEAQDALAYASKIHHDVQIIHASTYGLSSDLLRVAGEKFLPVEYSWSNAPEQSVAMEVLRRIKHDGNGLHFKEDRIHFASHSRGALIVERGLEFVREHLRELNYDDTKIHAVSSHITTATFEGASYNLLEGVRSVNIANREDPVPMVFGVGRSDGSRFSDMQGNVSQAATYVPAPTPKNPLEAFPIVNIAYVHDVESAIIRSPESWGDAYSAASQPELLKNAPSKNSHHFSAIVLNAEGEYSLRFVSDEHFRESGRIIAVSNDRITQSPSFGVFVVYRTEDLLHGMSKPAAEAALHRLEDAAARHEEVNLSRDERGVLINGLRERVAEAVKMEVGKAMKDGRKIGEERAQEHVFRFLNPNGVRATYDGKSLIYHLGEMNTKGLIVGLDDKYVTLQTNGGTMIIFNRRDLLHNAKNPQALDATLREAHQAGNPVHMGYMIGGKVDADEISHALYQGRSMKMGM
jgi:hypothetical protein